MDRVFYWLEVGIVIFGFLEAMLSNTPSIQIRGIAIMIMCIKCIESYSR